MGTHADFANPSPTTSGQPTASAMNTAQHRVGE